MKRDPRVFVKPFAPNHNNKEDHSRRICEYPGCRNPYKPNERQFHIIRDESHPLTPKRDTFRNRSRQRDSQKLRKEKPKSLAWQCSDSASSHDKQDKLKQESDQTRLSGCTKRRIPPRPGPVLRTEEWHANTAERGLDYRGRYLIALIHHI